MQRASGFDYLACPKICDLYPEISIEEYVLGLEITMDNALSMHIVQRVDELCSIIAGAGYGK